MNYQLSDGSDPLTQAVIASENTEELMKIFESEGPSDTRALARAVERSFRKDLASLGRGLFDDHAEERRGVAATHVFHGFDGAMRAAFPGWPDDLTAANRFASHLFFSSGGIVALGDHDVRREITRAFERFVGVLWPRKKAGDIPIAKQITLLKIIAKGVKYCSADHVDRKYRIDLGPPVRRRGEVFDSKTLFETKIEGRYVQGSMSVPQDDTRCRSIWVMTWSNAAQEPIFYSHVGKLGRFHHSSFNAGQAVMAAGEWVIERGILTMINACSGHYRPEAWRFRLTCGYLMNRGVISDVTKVEVWKANNRELLPCADFVRDFSDRLASGYRLFPG